MSTVSRPDIAKLQEDIGEPLGSVPCGVCGKPRRPLECCPDSSCPGGVDGAVSIKPPEGVLMNTAPPVAMGAPANEIVLDMPVLVIRFGRGKCIVQDPIGTIVAIDDAPSKIKDGSSSLGLAKLLRAALTSTVAIEFDDDPKDTEKQEAKELTFTESRAVSDAIVKWSVELGKP